MSEETTAAAPKRSRLPRFTRSPRFRPIAVLAAAILVSGGAGLGVGMALGGSDDGPGRDGSVGRSHVHEGPGGRGGAARGGGAPVAPATSISLLTGA